MNQQSTLVKKNKANQKARKIYKVIAGKDNDPIEIGPVEIPCYVLEGEIRVITKRGMAEALGLEPRGNSLVVMAGRKSIKPFFPKDFSLAAKEFHFKTESGVMAHGYEATTLATIIEAVISAWHAGKLHHTQTHIFMQCAVLSAGFVRAGIIALIDEHTGYEKIKTTKSVRDAVIEACVNPELVSWMKQVPDDWWSEMLRVCGKTDSPPDYCPIWLGKLFKRVVWDYMPLGVYDEVSGLVGFKELPDGQKCRPAKLHQHLTKDCGLPQYQSLVMSSLGQLRNVPTPGKGRSNWSVFKERWDIAQDRNAQIPLI